MIKNPQNDQLRILVFDFDLAYARETIACLNMAGQSSEYCSHYDAFLDRLEAKEYDLVLFDINDSKLDNSFHAVSTFRMLNAVNGNSTKNVTKFVLYTSKVNLINYLADPMLEAANINGVMVKDKNNATLFEQIAHVCHLPKTWAEECTIKFKQNIVQPQSNVIQFNKKTN